MEDPRSGHEPEVGPTPSMGMKTAKKKRIRVKWMRVTVLVCLLVFAGISAYMTRITSPVTTSDKWMIACAFTLLAFVGAVIQGMPDQEQKRNTKPHA